MTSTNTLISINGLSKVYHTGEIPFAALKNISLDIQSGEFTAIMGHSGSGKSTLLHLLGGLDQASAGSIKIGALALETMNQTALAKFRRANIGFIFQFFNLIENLDIQANVELPALLMEKKDKKAIRKRAANLLEKLGIAGQARKYPWELSGGQQQRAAIARALINTPTLLLADEPTGNLDSASGREVLNILREFNAQGQTILMVTHDALAAAKAEQVLFLHDGQFVDRTRGGNANLIAQKLTDLK